MKNKNWSILLLFLFVYSCQSETFVKENFETAEIKTKKQLSLLGDSEQIPYSVHPDGKLKRVNITNWTSGFFPGALWYLYEYTKDEYWKAAAEKQMEKLLPIQHFTGHHDVGFMMYCSYGNAYRLTNDKTYEEILINSANALSTRFIKPAGVIRSWNYNKSREGNEWHCPVIIDNLMNLELLFFASRITGDDRYKNIAISHADSTLKYHIRDDYSTFHVVNYDTITGLITDRGTYQGFSDSSMWARGQAWGIYGFTMIYRETKDKKYLDAAQKMADRYLSHPNLPEDMVPYWDFNASDIPNATRDASAAAITASALFELAGYLPEKKYVVSATKILESLIADYITDADSPFILDHSVAFFLRNHDVDAPLNYADYYYLEALLRYDRYKR